MSDLLHQIRRIPVFGPLPDKYLEEIARSARRILVDAGDIIFSQGTQGETLYFILDGAVAIWKDQGDNETDLLAVYGPGQMFGELALIDDVVRSATVVAREPCELLGIEKNDFQRITSGDAVSRTFMKSLSLMVRDRTELFTQILKQHKRRLNRVGSELADAREELAVRAARRNNGRRELLWQTAGVMELLRIMSAVDHSPGAGPRRDIIRDIAWLSRRMADAPEPRRMEMSDLLNRVTGNLFRSLDIHRTQVRVEINAPGVRLMYRDAAAVALIARELTANALVHAFSGERSARVQLEMEQNDEILLRISDNGGGCDPPPEISPSKTPGLHAVSQIVLELLGGSFAIESDGGFQATVRFPAWKPSTDFI